MATKPGTRTDGKKAVTKTSSARRDAVLLKAKRKRHIWSVILFALGLLLILFALIGDSAAEKPNMWDLIHKFICGLFGISVFLIGPIFIYASVMISADKGKSTLNIKLLQMGFAVLLLSGAMQILFVGSVGNENTTDFFKVVNSLYQQGVGRLGGGVLGGILAFPLLMFGRLGASIIIILIIFVFIMILSNVTLISFLNFIGKPFKKAASSAKEQHRLNKEEREILQIERERIHLEGTDEELEQEKIKLKRFADIEAVTTGGQQNTEENAGEDTDLKNHISEQAKDNAAFRSELREYISDSSAEDMKRVMVSTDDISESPLDETVSDDEAKEKNQSKETDDNGSNPVEAALESYINEQRNEQETKQTIEEQLNEAIDSTTLLKSKEEQVEEILSSAEQYKLPPVDLLDDIIETNNDSDIDAELRFNGERLVGSLKSYGVQTKIVGICRGPSVTRYEIQPAPGVKIAKITSLSNDIAMNMAASSIRIEAPIPNKAAVGIEIPNTKVDTVPFRTLVESDAFMKNESNLAAVLGKDISGDIIIADIAKMPHILIAGTTGSGKSVCVNSIIMSILFRSTPEDVRFLMIDPKAVEFMIYNGIPHLLIPVVTEAKKAAGALAWAVTEMLNRYKMFAENNVRDLKGYNSLAKNSEDINPLPQIVIFIDELADLIMASKNEVEDSIVRLSQMARAAGMHLVIATQRPTVDVVTGLIKANVPSRIALKVSSQVDSRTIIDVQGAEKLLGRGDMLYYPVGMPKPTRVQGCWVNDKEVDRVVTFIKNSFILDYDQNVMEEVEKQAELVRGNDKRSSDTGGGSIDSSDEKLEEAIEAVIDAGQASTSYLQRKLKLGYGRAARLIDIMEEMGIVGPFEGSKPRQVLMSKEQWYERKINQQ